MIFPFKVKGGQIEYLNRSLLSDYMKSLKDGKYVITVDREYRNRSSQQNRYYHGVVLKTIAAELGYTSDEIHQIFKAQFLSYEKDHRKFVKSTAKLKTVEMEDYIEQVRRFAAMELGIMVPDPNTN